MLIIQTISGIFYIVYALCGISDILDGFLDRKYNIASKLGAILDIIADFVLAAIILILFTPIITWEIWIVIWVIMIAFVLLLSLAIGFIKFYALAFLHTYINKDYGSSIIFVYISIY